MENQIALKTVLILIAKCLVLGYLYYYYVRNVLPGIIYAVTNKVEASMRWIIIPIILLISLEALEYIENYYLY